MKLIQAILNKIGSWLEIRASRKAKQNYTQLLIQEALLLRNFQFLQSYGGFKAIKMHVNFFLADGSVVAFDNYENSSIFLYQIKGKTKIPLSDSCSRATFKMVMAYFNQVRIFQRKYDYRLVNFIAGRYQRGYLQDDDKAFDKTSSSA